MSGCDFLLAIAKCALHVMRSALLRGLAVDGYFGVGIKGVAGGNFKVDGGEAVKITGLAFYHRDASASTKDWGPSRVPRVDAEWNLDRFVGIIP